MLHRWRQSGAAGALLALLLLGGVAGTLWSDRSSAPSVATLNERAPQVALDTMDGPSVRLSEQRGRVVMLNFWATWCVPCRREMPALQRLADDLRDEAFLLWAINLQEEAPQIQPFTREIGLRVPVLLDLDGNVTRAYGVRGLPATFVIDRQGVLRLQRLGPIDDAEADRPWTRQWLEREVQTLLRG